MRRFPRDLLLKGIALQMARETHNRTSSSSTPEEALLSPVREGYLFQIAGICVTYCNNHRSTPVDDQAIANLGNDFHAMRPPEFDDPLSDSTWQKIWSRISYLQMPFQLSQPEPLARSLCLFGDDPRFGPPLFDDGWWSEKLGVTLSQFLKIALIVHEIARASGGSFPRQALLAEEFELVFDPVSPSRVLQVVDAWLARPIDDLVRLGRKNMKAVDDLWSFNPLYERPIVILEDGMYVTPSPRALVQRLAPQGLYFIVRDALDADANPKEFQRFTSELGVRFQQYVGRQLGLLEHATVHPEISYASGQKSVDYIVETPEVLVLVEVKSVSPSADTRYGVFPEGGDIDQKLNKACRQISRTAELIREGHPDLPPSNGRSLHGLVVTREEYFNLPISAITNVIKPASVPTTVVSSQKLDHVLAALSKESACGSLLLQALAPNTDTIKTDLNPLPTDTNPLLREIRDQWWESVRSLPS